MSTTVESRWWVYPYYLSAVLTAMLGLLVVTILAIMVTNGAYVSEIMTVVMVIWAPLALSTLVLGPLTLYAYYPETKAIREADVGWTPHAINYWVGHLFFGVVPLLIFLHRRKKYVGFDKSELIWNKRGWLPALPFFSRA